MLFSTVPDSYGRACPTPTIIGQQRTRLISCTKMQIPPRALVIGISLGGLVAAKVQEAGRPDLAVVCISSPTWADLVSLEQSVGNRTAIYSSADTVIAGRTSEWQRLARAYDVPWLTHNTDEHLPWLAPAIAACANDDDPGEILARH